VGGYAGNIGGGMGDEMEVDTGMGGTSETGLGDDLEGYL
jgi:hypothetical protein